MTKSNSLSTLQQLTLQPPFTSNLQNQLQQINSSEPPGLNTLERRVQRPTLPKNPGTVNDRTGKVKVDINIAVEVIALVVRLHFTAFLTTSIIDTVWSVRTLAHITMRSGSDSTTEKTFNMAATTDLGSHGSLRVVEYLNVSDGSTTRIQQ